MAMSLPLPTYTTDEVRGFPDDGQRYELLEGMLLVTPAPGSAHQVVLARLVTTLDQYLSAAGDAFVVSPGEVELAPKTLLQPDLLVFPAKYPPGTPWREMQDWWLAAEVLSPSSRIYDRDFKLDAYLALGVDEVWLVDLDERAVYVAQRGGEPVHRCADRVVWHPATMRQSAAIELAALFHGIP